MKILIVKDETSTKEMILDSAERLFSSSGFSETKISDISSTVGVSDSTVYEHFENKEDILFAIPSEKTQELIEINLQNLRGLVGVEIKLRKLIWNYLDFLVNNKNYATLLLFELRRSRDFYETENHKLIREFTKIYRQVIIEGQEEGKFRPEISPSLVLNLIFGTVDLILITWIIEENPPDPLDLFEDLFSLLIYALKTRNSEPMTRDKRKQILNAATRVFSELGYRKARIQDIARLAGVGDATIYKYFSGKEDILFTLPVENTLELLSIEEEHINGIKDTDLKLEVLIKDYLHYMESHREYGSICLFDLRYNRSFYRTEAYVLFRKFARVFYDIIIDGIEKGHFRSGVNPYVATKMIMGVIDHSLLSWIKFKRPEKIIGLSNPICTLVLSFLKA